MYADKKYVYVCMCVAPIACWCCRCLPGSQSKPTKHRLGCDTPIPRQHSVLFLSLFWQAAQLFLESCSQAQRGSTSACWCCRCLPGSQVKQKKHRPGRDTPIPRQHSVLFLSLFWQGCSQAQRGSTSACWCCRCLPGSQVKPKKHWQGATLPSLANIPCCFCQCFGRRRNFSWKVAARLSGGRPP